MRTLRSRLILSHILPLLLVIPIVGFALVYILETQVLVTTLSEELAEDAALTADLARDEPAIASVCDLFQRAFAVEHHAL
jgi:hypothetical protein